MFSPRPNTVSLQHKPTSRDHPLGDGQLFQMLGRISTLLKVDVLYVGPREIVLAIGERLQLFLHQVEAVESSKRRKRVSQMAMGQRHWEKDVLHIVETVEDGLDERGRELEKVGQFLLDEGVPVFIFVACNLEILLDLHSTIPYGLIVSYDAMRQLCTTRKLTLKRFFSSLKLFSFFSLSLLSELL